MSLDKNTAFRSTSVAGGKVSRGTVIDPTIAFNTLTDGGGYLLPGRS